MAFKIGNEYLAVQKTDGGFDYTIYDETYRVKDGGGVERLNASIAIVVAELVMCGGLYISNLPDGGDMDWNDWQEEMRVLFK